jgi:hypothetical protein
MTDPIGHRVELELATSDLLKAIFPTKEAARLLGVSVSGFVDAQRRIFGSDFFALIVTATVRYFGSADSIFLKRPNKRITEWRASL